MIIIFEKGKKMKTKYKLLILLFFIFTVTGLCSEMVYAKSEDFVVSKKGVLLYYNGYDKIVKVPYGVKEIGNNAFLCQDKIEKIILPESVTVINSYAFSGCDNLKTIVLPKKLIKIEEYAFNSCDSLTIINFPTTLKYLDGSSISECQNLKQINIPKDCTVYHWEEITEFNGLECINVDLKNKKYMSIDGVVFSKNGKRLICYPPYKKGESYIIPESVIYIDDANFFESEYLKHLTFGKNVMNKKDSTLDGAIFMNGMLEDITVSVKNKAFCDINGVLFSKDKKMLIAYPEGKDEDIYIVPYGTEEINLFTFDGTWREKYYLKYLVIPHTVTTFHDHQVIDEGKAEFLFDRTNIIIFGEKGSAIENYANGDSSYNNIFRFRSYESKSIEKIVLSEEKLSLNHNDTFTLYALSLQSYTIASITWQSSNESIISVNENGVAIAQETGIANITAITENNEIITCKVEVKNNE